jgi:hypothetical protein
MDSRGLFGSAEYSNICLHFQEKLVYVSAIFRAERVKVRSYGEPLVPATMQ